MPEALLTRYDPRRVELDPNVFPPTPLRRKQKENATFTTKVTKSTKLRSLKISLSETFVSFVCFVVR